MKKIILLMFLGVFFISLSDTEYEESPKYAMKIMYGEGYKSTLQNILFDWTSQKDPAGTTFVGISAEKYLWNDIWNGSLDITAQLGLIRHLENGNQDDFFQYNAGIKFIWKKFPWSKYVRTKLYALEGMSYVDKIPYLEKENLDFEGKPHSYLLNYLEFGLAFNLKELP